MPSLTPDESRALGVLIEKSTTTPEQYPMSLNALLNGVNQKSNRDPVIAMTEDQVYVAVEGLRGKGLAVRVDQASSRVHKYKHSAAEPLRARPGELAILAELLLRGPQTLGELRGRASRMSPIDSLETARELLRALGQRSEPLVKLLQPSLGSRAERYTQQLCPDLHPLEPVEAPASAAAAPPADPTLADRVAALESELQKLRAKVLKLCESLGVSDIDR